MRDEIAIIIDHVGKTFRLPHEKQSSIKSAFIHALKGGRRGYETQTVLKDISFTIKKGKFFGIVGRNGSGKSTLLKLLSGIYVPSRGAITVNGKLTPFIELGVGFSPELTGRENVYLNGALLGFNRTEMSEMYTDIVAFAELERFMDQKLKNYSSGMQVRLAFSIAIRVQSDILVLDEVLAVGDAAFQRKCYDYFMSLKKDKRTVVLVTHDMGAVRQYCDSAVMIERGEIVQEGKPEAVAQAYQRLFSDELEADEARKRTGEKGTKSDNRWGEGQIRARKARVSVNDEAVSIAATFRAYKDVPAPVYGFTINGPSGVNLLEGNTLRAHKKTAAVKAGDTVSISWELPNIFGDGLYSLSLACCDQSTTRFYDWLNEAALFKIRKPESTAGIVDPQVKIIEFSSGRKV